MKLHILTILSVSVVLNAFGVKTNTISNASVDWTVGASYEDTTFVPSAGDVVIVPSGIVRLNASTDKQSLALVQSLSQIILATGSSQLEINVTGSDDVTINVPMTGYKYITDADNWKGGPIVKLGGGTLNLTSVGFFGANTHFFDYYSHIRVAEGTLKLGQGFAATIDTGVAYLGRVVVDSGAMFFPPSSSSASPAGKAPSLNVRTIAGGGTITNAFSLTEEIIIRGTKSIDGEADFFGDLASTGFRPIIYGSDAQTFSGKRSTLKNDIHISIGSRLKVGAYPGLRSAAGSALGKADNIWFNSNGTNEFEYVGKVSDTTDHGFVFVGADNEVRPAVIDAGAYGGLTFIGQWQHQYKSTGGRNIILTGSNTVPCKVAGNFGDQFNSTYDEVRGHGLYVRKEGSGAWAFMEHPQRNLHGGFAISEGTLQVDTLANSGLHSSIGFMTNWTDGAAGMADTNAAHKTNYAIHLGAPDLNGNYHDGATFEYINASNCSGFVDRPIALGHNGTLACNVARTAFTAGPVFSNEKSGESTLYLDGSSKVMSTVRGISDGKKGAKVSVVKRGTGVWELAGDLTFSGDLLVEGGELVVRNPCQYTWYKWTVTALCPRPDGSSNNDFRCQELGLFDASGYRQNRYLICTNILMTADFVALPPGYAQFCTPLLYDYYSQDITSSKTGVTKFIHLSPDRMFDSMYAQNEYAVYGSSGRFKRNQANYPGVRPTQNDSSTWVSMVMRLKEGANPIAGWDFAQERGTWDTSTWFSMISNSYMSASIDGIHWDKLDTRNNVTIWYEGNSWVCQSDLGKDAGYDYSDPHQKYWPLTGEPNPDDFPIVFNNVNSIGVSGGATLRTYAGDAAITVNGLTLDAMSGGTIKGFTFGESGIINVKNMSEDDTGEQLPVAFENCTDLDKVENWSVFLDGKAQGGMRPTVNNGRIALLKNGSLIIFR